jgi:hypothetical protein
MMEPTLELQSLVATQPRGSRSRRVVAFWTGVGLVPVAAAAVAKWARSSRAGWIAAGVSALGFAALRWQLDRMWNDEPDYVVEERIGSLEIRRYLPRVEARTMIDESDFDVALERGFDRLAGYIFGFNRGGEKLAMTSPVTARGEALEMPDFGAGAQSGGHVMAFVMPPERAVASLPQPLDERVELVDVTERRVAVLRYSGAYRSDVVAARARELCELASDAGLLAKSEPVFAGFDPPWTLPFLRRSEVWLELE